MSRLIIKNLPKDTTEEKLRKLFGQKGTVTDVQLKYTADGKFRQFGFIGYQNENEAEEAIKYFNNSRIKTSKIIVEHCALLGDEKKPRAWSKYANENRTNNNVLSGNLEEEKNEKNEENKSKLEELLEKYKNDPELEDFIQFNLSGPTKNKLLEMLKGLQGDVKSKTELQNSVEDDEQKEEETIVEENEEDKVALKKVSDFEYMKFLMKKSTKNEKKSEESNKKKEKIKLFNVKLKDLPYKCKKKDIKHFFKPLVPYAIRIPPKIKGFAYVGFKTERQANQALLKNKSFIGKKQVLVTKYVEKEESTEEEKNDPRIKKWKSQEESLQNEEDIAESGRIFLRNLAYTTTEDDIEKLFSKYGPITEIVLPIDPITRKLKGFGVITFLMPEHAVKAYSELDGSIFQGRMLHLLPGKVKETDQEIESSNYKHAKASKEKSQAGSSHNWNSLFLGQNAVADAIAENYGTTKEAVLGPHGDSNAAVRLALGETQIVQSTKKFLEDEGVILDVFLKPTAKRSKTVILVKNLPHNTTPKELRDIFEKYGVIGRIILPPFGITALIEFIEPSEAKKAFTKLAYSKFKHVPLYLEWAPEGSLKLKSYEANKNIDENNKNEKESNQNDSKEAEAPEVLDNKEEETPEDDTTLFVKNLNFQTTDEALKKHFERCGKIYYANVALKKDINNPKNRLSMGYGFVQFYHKSSCNKALKELQGSLLDGKTLELKRSERTLKNDVKFVPKKQKLTKQTGTKILVRNVPFQAKRQEIWDLFSTFGELKTVRLPKKMSGEQNSHRGFAFVDFTIANDAKNAFETLCQSTHLYGRRLVLEWAATDGVDEIRKRTADHFRPTQEAHSKKSVLDIEKEGK